MTFGRMLKRKAKAAIAPTIFLAVVAYFAWNATQGAHGLHAYTERKQELAAAQQELAAAQNERGDWERRVASLRSDHLDLDMLDERVRAMLNLASPTDIVVPYGPGHRLF